MDVVTLFNIQYREYCDNISRVKEWFQQQGFIVRHVTLFINTELEKRIVMITYRNSTQRWEKWARQSRGTILYLNNENVWKPIRYILPRGAEILTNFHIKSGISETENMNKTNSVIFDQSQQDVMKKLETNSILNGYLSMKVDGMLVVITLYFGELKEILLSIAEQSNDPFLETLCELARETDCSFVPIISTQRTFNVTEPNTISYIVTAILSSCGIDNETMRNQSPMMAMKKYGKELLTKLKIFVEDIGLTESWVSLSIEAVCANRTCAWNIEHDELAVSYANSFIKILSYSINLTTIPHFNFSKTIHRMGLDEPFWWIIRESQTVSNMLQDLSRYIFDEITMEDYILQYRPSNIYCSQNRYLDPEGFIGWFVSNSGILDYHKIKSKEYYECHSNHRTPENIMKLLNIGQHTNVFPEATQTRLFFDNLKERLINVCDGIRYMTGLSEGSDIIRRQLIDVIGKKTPQEYLVDRMSQRMLRAYRKNMENIKQRCNILLNVGDTSEQIFARIITTYFNELQNNYNNKTHKILKRMILNTNFWSTNFNDTITEMIDQFDETIQKFCSMIFRQKKNSIQTIKYKGFMVFGCPTSHDIDIAVVVETRHDLKGDINKHELSDELNKLGYDLSNRELDINMVCIEDGNVVDMTKGGKEIQNMLYYTYNQHEQAYSQMIKKPIIINIEEKIRATSKFILDNMKILVGDEEYRRERINRRHAYNGVWNRVIYVESIIEKIVRSNTYEWRSVMKSVVMKIIQLILLSRDIYEYTKRGLANKFGLIYGDIHRQGTLWHLMRETEGEYVEKSWILLKSEFIQLCQNNEPNEQIWHNLTMDVSRNATELPDQIFMEFIRSPLEPSTRFEIELMRLCPDRSLNQIFPIRCENVNVLPEKIQRDHVIAVDQRTIEWCNLLTYYRCGRNSGVKSYEGHDWVRFYYNLIRGSIGELMIIKNVDFSQLYPEETVIPVSVGLLVKEKNKVNSQGMAPDLLLLLDNRIIPVEIKCVVGRPSDNTNYRREMNLAKKQLRSSLDILENGNEGVIVICYIYYQDNVAIFDVKATRVNFDL